MLSRGPLGTATEAVGREAIGLMVIGAREPPGRRAEEAGAEGGRVGEGAGGAEGAARGAGGAARAGAAVMAAAGSVVVDSEGGSSPRLSKNAAMSASTRASSCARGAFGMLLGRTCGGGGVQGCTKPLSSQ